MSLVDELKVFTHRNNRLLTDETIVAESDAVVDDELIKIGDNVIIVRSGDLYPLYTDMVSKMKLNNHCNRTDIDFLETYVVIRIEKHMDCSAILCGIENLTGKQFIIDINGLEKV